MRKVLGLFALAAYSLLQAFMAGRLAGVLLIRHPVGGVAFVALLIGLWLIAIGVIRFATAFEEYEHTALGWGMRGIRREAAGPA